MSKSKYGWRCLMVAALTIVSPAFAQMADLSIKVGEADPKDNPRVPYQSKADFTVTVTNAGPDSAAGVKITATKPATGKITGFGGECVPLPKDGGGDPTVCQVILADAGTVLPKDGTATFHYTVAFPEQEDLTVCPPADALKADVSATTADPTAGNNSSSLSDILYPLADIDGTAESDAPMVRDGGVPPKRYNPGDMVTLKGTIKNHGPCAALADSVTIDTIGDSLGLDGEDGSGICDAWDKGACTVPMAIAPDAELTFEVTRTIQPLTDAGGGSITQSAAYWNFAIDYPGSPATGDTAPTAIIMVKGPGGAACAVVGGGLLLPLAMLVLARRRRNNRG